MKPSTRAERYVLTRWRPVAVDDLVRVGRDHDGGYVISRRAVEATRVLVGMGLNDDWSFERDFERRQPAVRVVGLDGSVSPEIFRRRAAQAVTLAIGYFFRLKRSLMNEQRREAAYLRERAADFEAFFSAPNVFYQKFVSDTADDSHLTWATLTRLEPELARAEPRPTVFVKMDIERGEYRVLDQVLADASRIAGFAIEFHECDILWDRFAELMDRLQEHFAVVHIHGNNWTPLIPGTACPETIEVSAVNRALLPAALSPSTAKYPIPGLDMPNNRERPDLPLSF